MDDWWKSIQAGAYFHKIILTNLTKLIFRISWHQTMMQKQKSVGTVNYSWNRISCFSHTQRMLDEKFCLILRLESSLNSLRVHCRGGHLPPSLRTPALPPPSSRHRPQAELAPRSAIGEDVLWQNRSLTWGIIFLSGICPFNCLPQHSPVDPTPGMTRISQQPQPSPTRSPFPILPRP